MINRRVSISFIICCYLALIQGCDSSTEMMTVITELSVIEKEFNLNEPEEYLFEIANTASSSNSFSLQLNNNIQYNINGLAAEVHRMPNEFENEKLERKAWRFVRDNIKFNTAFTEEKWQHNPHLLVNSIGFGQCDDFAALLVQLWVELGFEARVWGLEGHVVCEVFNAGKWQMYDATYGVYYLNQEKVIASVQELSEQSELVEFPIEVMPFRVTNEYYAQFARYKRTTAEKYATQGNNAISEWSITDVIEVDSQITIPAQTSIRFPVNYKSEDFDILYSSNLSGGEVVNYLNVNVPKGITGRVKLPFVMAGIKGEGSVELLNKIYEIKELERDVLQSNFADDLLIRENRTGINIVYFINPERFKLRTKNTLSIHSTKTEFIKIDTLRKENIDKLEPSSISDIKANEANDLKRTRPFVKKQIAELNYKHFIEQKHNWVGMLSKMKTVEDLKSIFTVYYKTQNHLTVENQEELIKTMHEKIAYLSESNFENKELIMQICRRSDLMYFVNIIESNDVNEVVILLETLKKHIEL